MHKIETSRKARFKSALALIGETQKDWSEKNKISYMHLYYTVLHDDTDTVLEKVDKFIQQVESAAA